MTITAAENLTKVYVDRELNKLEQLRACAAAKAEKMTQVQIAKLLGISQPEVHRTLRRINDFPAELERSPKEVILLQLAGRLSHAAMMDELKAWPYTFRTEAEPGNPETEYTWGTWDQVEDQFYAGRLGSADYFALVAHVHPASAA
jgi:transcriptional regulator with XRE-family HTH domain